MDLPEQSRPRNRSLTPCVAWLTNLVPVECRMPTRLRKPSILKQLAFTVGLCGFILYLGYNVVEGQYGMTSREQMLQDIDQLQAESKLLKEKIDYYKHRKALFDPGRLDPDIITEQARAYLSMVRPDERIIMLPETTN